MLSNDTGSERYGVMEELIAYTALCFSDAFTSRTEGGSDCSQRPC